MTFMDCYVVFRKGKNAFFFGAFQSNLSIAKGYITKFKNPKLSTQRVFKNKKQIIDTIQTPETFLMMNEAIETLSESTGPDGTFFWSLKPRALKKLKKSLNISGIWIDISTGTLE